MTTNSEKAFDLNAALEEALVDDNISTDINDCKGQILLVEDEEDISETLRLKLVRNNYQVISTQKLGDATFKSLNQKFSLIVLDMRLPDGNGDTFIESVRNNSRSLNYRTPILVISAHLGVGLVKKIRQKVNGVLVKPFEGQAFIDKVNKLVIPKEDN